MKSLLIKLLTILLLSLSVVIETSSISLATNVEENETLIISSKHKKDKQKEDKKMIAKLASIFKLYISYLIILIISTILALIIVALFFNKQ